jgi:hypothetical protein
VKRKNSRKAKARSNAAGMPKSVRTVYLFLILALTLGISSVSRAAEKIKRSIKSKKANWKASYAALLTARAWAYFRPAWHKIDAEGFPAPLDARDRLLDDSDNRVEKAFRVTPGLRSRVAFWIDVYGRFSSQYRILHDKDNPDLIYGYLDLRPLYRSMPARMADARAYQIEQRVMKELKERIAEAMGLTKPRESQLTEDEKKEIRELFAAHGIRNEKDAILPLRRMRSQTGQRDHFLKAIFRAQKLLPQIEPLFKENGLPLALARLPFVESSFNRGACSKSGAFGIWQFLPETARLFAPSASFSEMADPIRQSKSAVRMFTILHQRFDDWGIAVTAYNSGATRIQRIVEKHGADTVDKLVSVPLGKDNLGFAGNNFYSELAAANLVQAYQDKIFSSSDMQIAKLDLPRRVQSLFEGFSSPQPIPTGIAPVENSPGPAQPPAAVAKKSVKARTASRSKTARQRPAKRIAIARYAAGKNLRRSRKVASYRPRGAARRA